VRGCLSVIDHNYNVNRPVKKVVDGDVRYTKKVTRDGVTYTAIPLKVPKLTRWRTEIMEEVVEAVRCGAVPSVEIPTDDHLKRYGKQKAKPGRAGGWCSSLANGNRSWRHLFIAIYQKSHFINFLK